MKVISIVLTLLLRRCHTRLLGHTAAVFRSEVINKDIDTF